ncbi:TIGR02679 family protein [Pseudonocardia lacus]|uniref:TIGR02679 family protein n=1 Tax=Pseudonocardia lacus TaxID=2835865 RepID=UPI001BDC0467|nr:TIGR02679 family protein [Pseudonocardia lacus]
MTLPAALRDPLLEPVWKVAHERLSSGRPVGTLRVGPLDEPQRAALADLLGLDRLAAEHERVRLDRLDAVLREVAGLDTGAVVEVLLGPLGDRAAERAAAAASRSALWSWLSDHEALRAQPALRDWAESLRQAGTSSPARTRELLERALTVLAHLPADGRPLPTFASDVLHDPHSLDEGTPLSGVVLRALACLHGAPPPANAEDRRALWERMGVTGDQLSVSVLAAGLRPAGTGLVPDLCRRCCDDGHAVSLTLAQLRSTGAVAGAGVVHVVENPSVLALALTRFGPACPPLVCTSGWPNGAAVLLLRQLAAGGARLRYHGDLDGEGVRIAAYVTAKTPATPWRMSAADYRGAVPATGRPVGRVTEAPWDADLATAMRERGVAVFEEQVVELLLADLAG